MSFVKMLLIDPSRCTGCNRCEMACSFSKEGMYNFALSRIRLMRLSDFVSTVPFVCEQCKIPWCTFACPSGAISRDISTGVVAIDADRCVGCLMCFLACPLGGISISPATRLPFKCDLCGGDPACVRACDYDAIQCLEVDDASDFKRRQGFDRLSEAMGLTIYSRQER